MIDYQLIDEFKRLTAHAAHPFLGVLGSVGGGWWFVQSSSFVHAAWIMEHYLQWHRRRVPEGGLPCKCYSRFDDVLGAAASVILVRGVLAAGENAQDPIEMVVYNWTGKFLRCALRPCVK